MNPDIVSLDVAKRLAKVWPTSEMVGWYWSRGQLYFCKHRVCFAGEPDTYRAWTIGEMMEEISRREGWDGSVDASGFAIIWRGCDDNVVELGKSLFTKRPADALGLALAEAIEKAKESEP